MRLLRLALESTNVEVEMEGPQLEAEMAKIEEVSQAFESLQHLQSFFSTNVAMESISAQNFKPAMEALSGGVIAMIIAGVAALTALIVKIVSFFTGGGSSSGGGGSGGGGGSIYNGSEGKKMVEQAKETIKEVTATAVKVEKQLMSEPDFKAVCEKLLEGKRDELINNLNRRECMILSKNAHLSVASYITHLYNVELSLAKIVRRYGASIVEMLDAFDEIVRNEFDKPDSGALHHMADNAQEMKAQDQFEAKYRELFDPDFDKQLLDGKFNSIHDLATSIKDAIAERTAAELDPRKFAHFKGKEIMDAAEAFCGDFNCVDIGNAFVDEVEEWEPVFKRAQKVIEQLKDAEIGSVGSRMASVILKRKAGLALFLNAISHGLNEAQQEFAASVNLVAKVIKLLISGYKAIKHAYPEEVKKYQDEKDMVAEQELTKQLKSVEDYYKSIVIGKIIHE